MPKWLGERMTRLGSVIAEAIVLEYGRDELLRRLAHPFWFQSFGAVMGMDWHSSGVTTSVIGALKRGLEPLSGELGVHVCGGRGSHSRKTPQELVAIGEQVGFDGAALATASRLVAKVDSAAVQDGFDLYLHGFIVTDDGHWVVVQQGMNGEKRQARRYHWLSEGLKSFIEEPHAAIDGIDQGVIVNLTDARAEASRRRQIDILGDLGPDRIERELARLEVRRDEAAEAPLQPFLPHLVMPARHEVRPEDIVVRRLHAQSRCGRRPRPEGFRRAFARAGGRRADGAGARAGRRGRSRRALSVQRPGAVLDRPWRQGPPPLSRAAESLRPHDRGDEGGGRKGEARPVGGAGRDQAARRPGAPARDGARGPSVEALFAEERERSHGFGGMSVFGPEPAPERASVRRTR